jgi:MFS family permease
LFGLTIVPGIVVIVILLRVPEVRRASPVASATAGEPATTAPVVPTIAPAALSSLPRPFYKAMTVLLIFSLGNASDAFLLLRLSDLGVATVWIPLLWSALHVVKVLSSLAGGTWSDTFGRRTMIGLGWICYALVYLGFGLSVSTPVVIGLFMAYGIYFGLTEGAEKAWVADMVPSQARGTAFGVYNAVLGVGALAASLLFGLIWTRVSPSAAFLAGATLSVLATLLLHVMFRTQARVPL